jgi:trehalose-phosphatase
MENSMSTHSENVTIAMSKYDAIVFDLDGVVTDTAGVHAASWKQLFDDFLKKHAGKTDTEFVPFDKNEDYLQHVDGKPRYKGVKDFLESRGITLDYGDPSDPPDKETVCGLGNKKNVAFRERLDEDGVVIFDSTVDLIEDALSKGLKIGIISSSKNCEPVLKRADLLHLFEVKVDGVDAAEMGLKGKPHPDVFLSAVDQLGVAAQRTVVVEDAISGVRAGERGNFGLVIGVDRIGIGEDLLDKGADVVVKDLAQVHIKDDTPDEWLPSAIQSFEEIVKDLDGKKLAVFLDYDGTLTPIVERPEDANIADDMREVVKDLSDQCTVAIVSGRDRPDVQERVGLDNIYYAGSHGFDIKGPEGFEKIHDEGGSFIETLDEVEKELNESLKGIEGAQVERKKFSVATHYRRVAEENVQKVKKTVDAVLEKHESLQRSGGKKVIEIQPAIDWHKGKALRWLMDALKLERDKVVPLYIGDDLTDENAFREIKEDGIGILVATRKKKTEAHYVLADTDAVRGFLKRLSMTI